MNQINEEKVLEIIKNKLVSIVDLNKMLRLEKAEDTQMMIDLIGEMEKSRKVMVDQNGLIVYLDPSKFQFGSVMVNKKGFGFIRVVGVTEEYFVPGKDLNDALDGDEVLFRIRQVTAEGKKQEATVIKIVNRSFKNVVGIVRLEKATNRLRFEIQNLKLQHYEAIILNLEMAIVNHMYVANLVEAKANKLEIKLVKDMGKENLLGNDIMGVAYEKGIKIEFDAETIAQANAIDTNISVKPDPLRKDLTSMCLVTIDGDDSKDFDDSIYCEVLDNGNYRLVVAIADVAHYVTTDSSLDHEALERGCSVYMLNKVIPMLPEILSNNVCSLVPDEVRLAMACDMEIAKNGEMVSHSIYNCYMKSHARLTYNQVNAFYSKKGNLRNSQVEEMIDLSKKVYDALWSQRVARGVVDFEISEPKFELDDMGRILDVSIRQRGISEQMIECFMIQANEAVAETVFNKKLPFIYRVHDHPKKQKLVDLQTQLKNFNVILKGKLDEIKSKDIQATLATVNKDDPNFQIIANLFLRSMEKAKYDIVNIGHFGLASECYTHFTSPIRRYPDLVVHRALKQYLIEHKTDAKTIDRNLISFDYAADISSKNEMKAVDCERDVIQMKKVEYMTGYINQAYPAAVSGVTRFGIFVELANTVEGLVHITDLKDDYYEYDDKTNTLVGRHHHNVYHIGKKLKVVVKQANKKERTVDFSLWQDPKYRRQ